MQKTAPQSMLVIGSLLIIIGALLMSIPVFSQDEGFIYGKVYTEDDRVYEGPIRWGKEEIYWVDMFNSSKERNENLRFLSDRDRERLDERNYEWYSWDDHFTRWIGGTRHWKGSHYDNNYIHQFSCQFGEIKSLRPLGKEYCEIELRNGQKFEVSGEGYNDIGLDIRIADKEIGEVEVYWGRIDRVEFMDTPSKIEMKFGQPLYGTVEAYGEKFLGYIQWDHDERVTTDKLDGDSDDGDVAIEFGKIRSIERKGGRSLVILKSGRELWLDGSNDVSSGHRGVIVMNKDFPSIDIPWNEFEKVTFDDKNPGPVAIYKDFTGQKELTGKVTTLDGKSYSGRIIYDLDETHDYELLQGKEGEFQFITAFRNIKRITTKGTHRCTVELRNGKKITLDEGQDVDEKNQGLLVFDSDKSDPKYFPWNEVSEIEFK
jgi:hypothetical protein